MGRGVADPLTQLKLIVGYAVVVVWVVAFGVFLFGTKRDDTALIAVQASLMVVLGALYGVSLRSRRNGHGSD